MVQSGGSIPPLGAMINLDNMTEFERQQQIDEDAERKLQRENDRENEDDRLYHLLKDERFSNSEISKMNYNVR